MYKVDRYVNSIIENSKLSSKESEELRLEIMSHIMDNIEEYKATGIDEEEAISMVISNFDSDHILKSSIYAKPKSTVIPALALAIYSIIVFVILYNNIRIGRPGIFIDFLTEKNILINMADFIPGYTIYYYIKNLLETASFINYSTPLLFLLFIPIGYILNFVTKINNLKLNLKIYIILVLLFQCITSLFLRHFIFNIDFSILFLLGCIVGFKIYSRFNVK